MVQGGGGNFTYLIGVVVSRVVEVVADGRGQHDEQVDAVDLTPQVRQPDQTVHLLTYRMNHYEGNPSTSRKMGDFPSAPVKTLHLHSFIAALTNDFLRLKRR